MQPPLRVDPELRSTALSVLEQGETLSGFVMQTVRDTIQQRRAQTEFLARGLASRDEAKRSRKYYSAASVLADLDRLLQEAEAKPSS